MGPESRDRPLLKDSDTQAAAGANPQLWQGSDLQRQPSQQPSNSQFAASASDTWKHRRIEDEIVRL